MSPFTLKYAPVWVIKLHTVFLAMGPVVTLVVTQGKCLCMIGETDIYIKRYALLFLPIKQIYIPWERKYEHLNSKGKTCIWEWTELTKYCIKISPSTWVLLGEEFPKMNIIQSGDPAIPLPEAKRQGSWRETSCHLSIIINCSYRSRWAGKRTGSEKVVSMIFGGPSLKERKGENQHS